MTPSRHADGTVVVVHAADRMWRTACDAALRAAGVRTRLSSRQAELAKSLADGLARLIVTGPAAVDGGMVTDARASCPVLNTTPDDTISEIVRRALECLQTTVPPQVTSSE